MDYCTRVRSGLQTFSYEEKRIALRALNIQVTWAASQALTVIGSIPLDGAIVSNTAKGRNETTVPGGIEPGGGDRDVHGIDELPSWIVLGTSALSPAKHRHP